MDEFTFRPISSARIPTEIALGFAFFTLAAIFWAGRGYRSWDPKEAWALIGWLNYAVSLRMRLTKG